LRRGGNVAHRRHEARRAGAAGHHACSAGWIPRVLSPSPEARQEVRGRRARHRVVEAPKVAENIMSNWLGLPPLATTQGGQIDSLIGWIHVLMFILFIGWGAFITYTLICFRRSRHPVANHGGVTSHTSSYLEG